MDDPSQSTAIQQNSLMTLPSQTLSCSRNQTVVVERRRRRILLAKPGLPGSMYSMVAVEDVEVVRTTTVHPRDNLEKASHAPRRIEYDAETKKIPEGRSGVDVMNGRARYINSFQQRKYHYLPNGPARRSRYNVPPKHAKSPASSFVPMPPTTHVIHPRERDHTQEDSNSNDRQQQQQQQQSPSPSTPTLNHDRVPPGSVHPEQTSYFSARGSSSYSHSPRSRFDYKTSAASDSHSVPSSYSKETRPSLGYSRFELLPDSEEDPEPATTNPREGLGSREHELKELREFWKEFYA